ncbi:MAG: M4 family metallopeptidase [Bacteroidetes bacterium]|nr:M4 family metallopeptidase [Bacteroidota bacterium]
MKKLILNTAKVISIAMSLFVTNIYAQQNKELILEAEYNNSNLLFSFKPHPSWSYTSLENLPKVLSEIYNVSGNFTFKAMSTDKGEGYTVTKYMQTINGYPVDGGDIIISRKSNGQIEQIIGTLRDPLTIVPPTISSEKALEIANNTLEITPDDYFKIANEPIRQPKINLKYAALNGVENAKVVLCYEIEILTNKPTRVFLYINATNGNVEFYHKAMHTANGTGNSLYSGNGLAVNTKKISNTNYRLEDTARKIRTIYCYNDTLHNGSWIIAWDADNNFTSTWQKAGIDVHYGIAKTYDYFKTKHNRTSYDNNGTLIRNFYAYLPVDEARNGVTGYNNAFWNGSEMMYGTGDGNLFSALVSVDIAGHEFSHAVVEKTANLQYRNESGALNESFADIFGYCIEDFTEGGSNWQIGEDCFSPATAGDALRNMQTPKTPNTVHNAFKQPNCYDGTYWTSQVGCVPNDNNDLCGVHGNSGVGNYWFYLLTAGSGGDKQNDKNKTYNVTGITRAKSEKIVYRALSQFMTAHSDYKAARKATLLAAEKLYGYKSNEWKQVCNAWYAVNVGDKCCDTLEVKFDVINPKCHDSHDGEIDLTIKKKGGGKEPEYYWHKGDTTSVVFSRSQDVVGLDSGNYVVVIKDTVAKCEIVADTNLVAPDKLKLTVSGSGVIFGACQRSFTVTLTANASGGTEPYTYNWPNGIKEIICSGGSGFFRTYTATVIDKNNCTAEATAWVMYIPITCSYDPNDIIGPPSYGDKKWVSVNATLPYKIRYENDPKFATGPAQKVSITHPLDTNVDLTSFRLSSFGFYKYNFDVPSNSTTYSDRLDLRDSFGIYLDVTAGVDINTREAFWIFESIDPTTGVPPLDGNKGYLAINDTITHKGEGYVNYTIKPKSTAKTLDSIRAKATIVFDDNTPVPTPRIHNIIDAVAPTSYIKDVPAVIDSNIVEMYIKAKDDTLGSGVGYFNIFVSENDGPYNLVANKIQDTIYKFRGNFGSSYKAYSIAFDNTDNEENDKTSPDITFSIASNEFFKPIPSNTSLCSGDTLKIRWQRSFFNSIKLQYTADSGVSYTTFATNLSGSDTLYKWVIPSSISGIKKYFIRSLTSTDVVFDTSDIFELKQGPIVNLGRDTSLCDGTSFSFVLDAGSGYPSYKWNDSTTNQTKTVNTYGTYWVKVTASTGCKSTDEFKIIKNLLPVVSSKSTSNPMCFGDYNGSIDITVVSGTAPYKYKWNNNDSTQDLSSIAAGTYIVTITDVKTCSIKDTTLLTQPAKLTISHVISNVKCFGGSDGSVDITVTGGTAPYTYVWSNSATTQDLSGLAIGKYYLQVIDDHGCFAYDTIEITQPPKLAKSHTLTHVKCFGQSTGAFDVTITGGVTPYSYSWSNSSTNEDLTNVPAGTYYLTVTDANLCIIKDTGTITQPSAPLASTKTQVDVKCYGDATGSIDLTVTGGTPGYTYSWTASGGGSVPSGQSINQDLTGLIAGTYSVTITDANSCTLNNSATITQPAAPLASSNTKVDVKCFGDATGSIDLTVTGGTTSYSYSWTASGGGSVPTGQSTNQDLTGLIAGTYSVTITDANNCINTRSVTISQPTLLTSSGTQVNVKCYGDATGSIDLSVTGGTPVYTYSWTASGGGSVPSGQSTNQDLSGLIAGTYSVTITDAYNCIKTNSFTITQPSAPLASTKTQINVKCYGDATGSIDLTVTGGTPGYTYSWTASGGGSVPSGQSTNQDLTGLIAGTYSVTITDANSCTTNNSATITQPSAPLSSSLTQVNVKCYGDATGSIDLTVTGGTTGYTYSWTASGGGSVPSGQSTNQDLTGLIAGTYSVTITDANNCTNTKSTTITQPSAPITPSYTQVNVKCYSNSTGSIDLTVTGGTPGYTYSWTASGGGSVPSGQSTNQDLTGLVAGTYTVLITDANNCTKTVNVTITQPSAALSSSLTKVDVKCYGDATGSIDLTVTGGTTAYSYSWTASGGGSVPSGQSTNQDLTGLIAGTYSVTITDANSCTTTNSSTITQPSAPLSSSLTQVNVKCYGDATGSIDLTVTGGTTGYTYSWTASGGGSVPSGQSTNQDLTGLIAGTYSVTITDANNCTNTKSTTITQPSAALSSSYTKVDVKCYSNSTGSIDLTVTGGTTGYTYSWTASGGGSVPSGQSTNQDLTGLVAGTYSVTITDANGCTATNSVTITQPSAALASSKTRIDVKCNGDPTGSIDLTATGGTTPYSYSWTATGGGSVPSGQSTNQDLTGLVDGYYFVTVTDANGCTTNDSSVIKEPTKLVISHTITDVNCYGGNDGAVNITVSGGILPYTFNWSNSATTEDINNLISGNYSVTVTDKNGCTINDAGYVNQPTLLVATHIVSDVNCFDGSDGAINLTVSGSVAPYTFSWSSGDNTEDISGKTFGWYKVKITDSHNCILFDSAYISQPAAPLASSVTISAVKCFGGNDGSVDLTVTGGTSPYTYAWSNSSTTQDINNLILGTYYVTITDKNNCILKDTADVTQPLAPLATIISKIYVKCFGDATGSADLTVNGGTTPYTYLWSNSSTNEDLSNLITGKYKVLVTDKNMCTITDSVFIKQPSAPLSSTISAVAVNCFGGNDGSVLFNVAGGTLPYTYLWSNGATTQNITNLTQGKYVVTVSDSSACILKDSIVVTQPTAPLSTSTIIANVKCKDGSDGSVNLTVTGGTTPYSFSWSSSQTSEDISNVPAGHYVVTVTDKNLCVIKDSADVTEPTKLLTTTDGTSATPRINNGHVWVIPTGGTQPYSYTWSMTSQNNDTIHNVGIGTYYVTVTDANGCSNKDTIFVPEAPVLELIKLYPNPTIGFITVSELEAFGLDLPITFELYDLKGKLRMTFEVIGVNTYTFRFDDALYNGSYILRMYNDRYEENRKVYLLR